MFPRYRFQVLAVVCTLLLFSVPPVLAQTESILYDFNCDTGPCLPAYDLAIDGQGNLYGATYTANQGVVYKLTPTGEITILHVFGESYGDGAGLPAGVILDSQGNLYGATSGGGSEDCGIIFELSPSGSETILYDFMGEEDGCLPEAGVVMDGEGNLYGTTWVGSLYYGDVYKFVRSTGTVTTLYTFTGGNDGAWPNGVVLDKEGNLYGTTQGGGRAQEGVVFKVTPSGEETVLHTFEPNGKDGFLPLTSVILDSKDNVYGTTREGGAIGVGTVYEVTPSGKETILHSFKGGEDGIFPGSDLMFDSKGNLYGTTYYGGTYDFGTVFKLAKTHETILHSFDPNGVDGLNPLGGVVFNQNGTLFGTTLLGGPTSMLYPYGSGTVYEITPQALAVSAEDVPR